MESEKEKKGLYRRRENVIKMETIGACESLKEGR